jgi:hypothetical protein
LPFRRFSICSLAISSSKPTASASKLTHQNRAAALIFVRDAQTDLAPDWGTFFLIFRADHPSIRTRIEFANSYKPWEQGAPLVYGNVCKSE